jgi:hypothetical protein
MALPPPPELPPGRRIALHLMSTGAALIVAGGLFDVLLPSPPAHWSRALGHPVAELTPGTAVLLMALVHALGAALAGGGIAALYLIHGPLRRGDRWAAPVLALLATLTEGVNGGLMLYLGEAMGWGPITFASLVLGGLALWTATGRAAPDGRSTHTV